MDKTRIKAYRELLFWGMLHIRHLCQWSEGESPDPEGREIQHRDRREAGVIAYWMHNLAAYSADDFVGFKEDEFWRSGHGLKQMVPSLDIEFFRQQFEKSFVEAQQPANEKPSGNS